MSSPPRGKPSLDKVEAVPESVPRVETEAESSESSLAKASSTDLTLFESLPGGQTWESKAPGSLVAWVSESQHLGDQVAKVEAWETQKRFTQPKQVPEQQVPRILKQKTLIKKVGVPKKKKNEVLFTRPLWSNKVEYLLALVGYSVKSVNLWRFPYLWLHYGSWSFFIIYIFLMFTMGIPLLFLEMAVGHRMRQCSIGVWKIIGPWVGGVGYTSFMVCSITSLYLNVFNAWILTYLSHSFQYSVPWEHCPLLKNSSAFDPECERTTPSVYFWYRVTVKVSDRIEDGGPPVFSLTILFLLSWCLVGAFMINGIKFIGKVMYILVPVPFIIMLCFFIRGVLLDGAVFGLQHLKDIKVSAMYDPDVWFHAGIQVLFTMGLGYGSIVSLSSYMNPTNYCLNDALLVALVNLGYMILAIPTVFCVLGYWATVITYRCSEKNAEILSNLVIQGKLPPEAQPPGNLTVNPTAILSSWINNLPQPIQRMVYRYLDECDLEKQFLKVNKGAKFAFLAFIEAMSFVPGSVLWTTLFFLMLLIFGLNVTMGTLQGIITPLQDTFSSFRKCPKLLTVVVFVLMFLCGLFFVGPSGFYYVMLLNEHWIVLPVIITILCENMAVGWAYGARRLLADLAILWGRSIHPICHWLWCCVSPVMLLLLFTTILILLSLEPMTYVAWDSSTSQEVLRPYPSWVLLAMVALFLIVIAPVPVYSVYCFTRGIPFKPESLDGPRKDVPTEEILEDNQSDDQLFV